MAFAGAVHDTKAPVGPIAEKLGCPGADGAVGLVTVMVYTVADAPSSARQRTRTVLSPGRRAAATGASSTVHEVLASVGTGVSVIEDVQGEPDTAYEVMLGAKTGDSGFEDPRLASVDTVEARVRQVTLVEGDESPAVLDAITTKVCGVLRARLITVPNRELVLKTTAEPTLMTYKSAANPVAAADHERETEVRPADPHARDVGVPGGARSLSERVRVAEP